jgi:DNA (cytosine-5)-methyltransferase 1
MSHAYYNEHDPKAAAWLRELIRRGHLPAGVVDETDIQKVKPEDLTGYTQCHFFAGIGGWALALRLAGWSDDKPVWTGSCPCQPFSNAGKRLLDKDPRHLWPVFRDLIAQCRPSVVFGEQVASKAGRVWLAGVRAEMEALGHAFGAADLCAPGLGSPHIRQRLWWVGYTQGGLGRLPEGSDGESYVESSGAGEIGCMGNAAGERRDIGRDYKDAAKRAEVSTGIGSASGLLEHASSDGREQRRPEPDGRSTASGCCFGRMEHSPLPEEERLRSQQKHIPRSPGFWDAYDLVWCRDQKYRRVEPGAFPLAHGIPGRVGLLRGYGNAIVPQVAAVFIQAAEEAFQQLHNHPTP